MNMFSRMNLRRRAPFSYLEFCIYSPVWSKKLLNSLWSTYLIEIRRQKLFVDGQGRHKFFTASPSIFFSFQKWLCEVYRRFGMKLALWLVQTIYFLSAKFGGNVLPAARFLVVIFFVVRAEFEASVLAREETQYAPWLHSPDFSADTLRYIVGKIGRLSLQLAKTARNDIINSIRENKLTFKNRNNGMRRWDALDKWDSSLRK